MIAAELSPDERLVYLTAFALTAKKSLSAYACDYAASIAVDTFRESQQLPESNETDALIK